MQVGTDAVAEAGAGVMAPGTDGEGAFQLALVRAGIGVVVERVALPTGGEQGEAGQQEETVRHGRQQLAEEEGRTRRRIILARSHGMLAGRDSREARMRHRHDGRLPQRCPWCALPLRPGDLLRVPARAPMRWYQLTPAAALACPHCDGRVASTAANSRWLLLPFA